MSSSSPAASTSSSSSLDNSEHTSYTLPAYSAHFGLPNTAVRSTTTGPARTRVMDIPTGHPEVLVARPTAAPSPVAGPSGKLRAKPPRNYTSGEDLLAALKTMCIAGDEVDFSGSYLVPPADLGQVSDKQRVQMVTHEIWKSTGYRFTCVVVLSRRCSGSPGHLSVKDHPPTQHGYKTRLWCSQDQARQSSRSRDGPRTTKTGEQFAKQRFACRSRLMITCIADSSGVGGGARTMTVRFHHYLRHEAYVEEPPDPSAPPSYAQPLMTAQFLDAINAPLPPHVVSAAAPSPPPAPLSVPTPQAREGSWDPIRRPSAPSAPLPLPNIPSYSDSSFPPTQAANAVATPLASVSTSFAMISTGSPVPQSISELQHALQHNPRSDGQRRPQQQFPQLAGPSPSVEQLLVPPEEYCSPPHPTRPLPMHVPPHLQTPPTMQHPLPVHVYAPPTETAAQYQFEGPAHSPHATPAHQMVPLPHEQQSLVPQPMPQSEFKNRMASHISRIRDFAMGLEYQVQFGDQRLLEVLERDAAPFMKLVEDCLRREGRIE
ncbi:hypothetical protein MKEN_00310300 [Mycena kentingensis (nom. inval.)]|nr:hypothetical protein MKEN_00310300 [Mycena kentingensis (nom. inval.)]